MSYEVNKNRNYSSTTDLNILGNQNLGSGSGKRLQ